LEPDLPGHVHNCLEVAASHGVTHVLEDYGTYVKKEDETDFYLKQVCEVMLSKDSRRPSFSDAVAKAFEPDDMLMLFEERERAIRFAEYQAAKVLSSNVDSESRKIDFSIAPEPTRFDEVQPEVCAEVKPLQIAEDNAACIAQATAGLRHVRKAKHYEVKLAFLQQLVIEEKVDFVYCPTEVQYADIFTKSLEKDKFIYFRDLIFGIHRV
jgi:hypothetical protein